MKKLLNESYAKIPKNDIQKYAGILKTEIDPIEYKNIRNEWE